MTTFIPNSIITSEERRRMGLVEKYNAHHKPAGSPNSSGGEFAPKDSGFGAPGTGYTLRGGEWKDAKGKPASAAIAARIKKLGISQGYKDVRLHKNPKNPLQARVTDMKGREKRFYSAEHHEKASAAKFERLRAFHQARPGILRATRKALLDPGSPDHDSALVLHLIDHTGFRVGSDRDTGADKHAYGATTLLGKHVRIRGPEVQFSFVGKNGKTITHTMTDATLSTLIAAKRKISGERGRLFPGTSDVQMRDFLAASGGEGFKVKDFRTWKATALASDALRKAAKPKSQREFKKLQREVAIRVSTHLGNTPAMALKAYIDPMVWIPVGGDKW